MPYKKSSLQPIPIPSLPDGSLAPEPLTMEDRTQLAELGAEIGAILTMSKTMAVMLQKCTESLVHHLEAAFVRIWTLRETNQILELQASAGLYTHLEGPHSPAPVGEFIIGLIAQERKPHLTNSVIGDPRLSDQEWAKREGMVAFAGYPLMVEDKLIGVVAIFSRKRLTNDALKTLASVSNAISLGIDRRRSEERTRKSEDRLRAALAVAKMGTFRWDIQAELLELDSSLDSVFGLPEGKTVTTLEDLMLVIHPQDQLAVAEAVSLCALDGTDLNIEFRIVWPDGTVRWIADKAKTFLDDNGLPCYMTGACVDITERRQAEEEAKTGLEVLRKTQEQLQQSQKMESIGNLAGGIAHDFNNLLTAINGYSQLCLSMVERGHPLYGNLQEIIGAGERAANLTQQLLAFSRKQVLAMVPLNLNQIVSEMLKMLQRLIGEDVDLVSDLYSSLNSIKGDRGQIEQVLLNLVVNARDASPGGGQIFIGTENKVWLGDEVNRPEVLPGNYVVMTLRDNGIGMDSDTQSKIFEPFYTTKPFGKGSGMGLSMVYGIVNQMGGHIFLVSELNRGSEFKIFFPVTEMMDPKAGSGKTPLTTVARGMETILLVEDEIAVRRLTQKILQEQGYQVVEAENGVDALEKAGQHQGDIHLLLTDVIMPKLNGRDAAEKLLITRPEARIVFMSGYTGDAALLQGMPTTSTFIQKPFTPDALTRAVRSVLDEVVLK